MEDEQILRLFFARSEQAIIETQRTYGAYCRTIADNILDSPEDCEECLDDVYMKLWEQIPPRRPKSLRAFLGAVTRNTALSMYRANHAEKRGGGTPAVALGELEECIGGGSAEQALEEALLVSLINRFLGELPRQTRIIFVKRYWYLASVRSIAKDVGAAEGKVKMTLLRTRKQLKRYLEKEGIDL